MRRRELVRGQRVILHLPGQPEHGWRGYVDAISPTDVVVRLDQPTTWGRLVSLLPHQVFPVLPSDPD